MHSPDGIMSAKQGKRKKETNGLLLSASSRPQIMPLIPALLTMPAFPQIALHTSQAANLDIRRTRA